MTTRVLLLRHAQTDRPTIFHGYESDTGLSELGSRQAATIAPLIARQKPDVLISSGMLRARLTAEPIRQACQLPVLIEPALHERKVGILVGTPSMDEWGLWPNTLKDWMAGKTWSTSEGAESYDQMQERLLPVWHRLMSEHHGRTIVVVAHGIVCRVLLLALLPGYSISDWPRLGRIQNVSITELEYRANQGVWNALRIGEVPPEISALESPPPSAS